MRERALLASGDHVLVACSGGPDSVGLTHAMASAAAELGIRITVASVDHGLRAEAKDDVAVAQALASDLGLPFHGLAVHVDAGDDSLQGAARDARYAALIALARDIGADRIAVGHTLDDQAETVLDRLLRGAGIRGVAGIAPAREDGVIRPLIDCRREDVHAYAQHHGLRFVRDRSNEDPRFRRVRIRSALLPRLADEDPAIAVHLAALADEARDVRALVDNAVAEWQRSVVTPDEDPRAESLRALPTAIRRAALGAFVVTKTGQKARRPHILAMEKLLSGGGEVLLGGGFYAHLHQGNLVVEHRSPWRARGGGVPCGPSPSAPQD